MNALLDHFRAEYVPTLQVIWPALLTAAALAVAGGVVGVFVVLRRETLVALSMPQIVTLGAAIGLRLGWPTLPPALAAVALSLLLMAWCRRRESGNLLLPALYIAGVCLSILVIANAGAHLMEVQNLFTGIDVAVDESQAILVSIVLTLVAVLCGSLWRRWVLLGQSPAAAGLAQAGDPVDHPVALRGVAVGVVHVHMRA